MSELQGGSILLTSLLKGLLHQPVFVLNRSRPAILRANKQGCLFLGYEDEDAILADSRIVQSGLQNSITSLVELVAGLELGQVVEAEKPFSVTRSGHGGIVNNLVHVAITALSEAECVAVIQPTQGILLKSDLSSHSAELARRSVARDTASPRAQRRARSGSTTSSEGSFSPHPKLRGHSSNASVGTGKRPSAGNASSDSDSTLTQKQYQIILKAAEAMMEEKDFAACARIIFEHAKAATGASAGYVGLLSTEGEETDALFLDPGPIVCAVSPQYDPLKGPCVRGLRALAYRVKEITIHNDYYHSEHWKNMPPGHAIFNNVMFVPLIIEDEVVGLLGLANKEGDFTEEDKMMCSYLGRLVSVRLHSTRALEQLHASERLYHDFVRNLRGIAFQLHIVTETDGSMMVDTGKEKGSPEPEGKTCPVTGMHESMLTGGEDQPEPECPVRPTPDIHCACDPVPEARNGGCSHAPPICKSCGKAQVHQRAPSLSPQSRSRVPRPPQSPMSDRDQRPQSVSQHRRFTFMHGDVLPMTGYRPSHFEGHDESRLIDLVVPEDRKRVLARHNEVSSSRSEPPSGDEAGNDGTQHAAGHNIKFKILRKDGARVSILESARRVGDFLEVTWQDVTANDQQEERQRDLENQLHHAQRLESLGVLAGGIAHDFNNILSAVMGNAQFIMSALDEVPKTGNPTCVLVQKDVIPAVKDIEDAATRAAKLSQLMLSYSGKAPIVPSRQNLDDVIKDMMSLIQSSIHQNAQLDLNLHGNLPSIEFDVGQIQQVIFNLAINASEALHLEGGMIVIESGLRECTDDELMGSEFAIKSSAPATPGVKHRHSAIQVNAPEDLPRLRGGRFVFVSLKDTGVGMDSATLARVFEPFFSTKFPGRGLALSASAGIVRKHGGTMSVKSKLGSGTEFQVLLPIGDHASASIPSAVKVAAPSKPTSGIEGRADPVDVMSDTGLTAATWKSVMEGQATVAVQKVQPSVVRTARIGAMNGFAPAAIPEEVEPTVSSSKLSSEENRKAASPMASASTTTTATAESLSAATVEPTMTKSNSRTYRALNPSEHTILLVDDEMVIRMVASRLLKKVGYDVLLAVDGIDGVEVFESNVDKISCVILDLSMPRLDGEGAFKEMKNIKSNIPIIISSGYDREDVTARFGAAIFGVLPKPVRALELQKMVSSAIASSDNEEYSI